MRSKKIKELLLEVLKKGISCVCDQCYWSSKNCSIAKLALELGVAKKDKPCDFTTEELIRAIEKTLIIRDDSESRLTRKLGLDWMSIP